MFLKIKSYSIWLAVIMLLSCIFFLMNAKPINGDSLLAWPISESVTNPDLYRGGDLIVEAGKTTNFLLYKVMSYLPFQQNNLPLRDTLVYFPIFVLSLFAWFLFFKNASKSTEIAFLGLVTFLFADNKFGLHWSYSPLPFLVSYSAIHFLQVLALYFLYLKKYEISFFLLGLSSFFHPATALSYIIVFFFIIMRESNLKKIISSAALFSIPFLLNYFFFLKTVTGKFFGDEHFRIYEVFQYHAFIRDHFHEGYLFFFASLGLIYTLRKFYFPEYLLFLKRFISVSVAISILWLINLYFFKNLTFLYFYFPMRIFYLIKPLMIFSLVWGIAIYLKSLPTENLNKAKKLFIVIVIFLFAKCLFRYSSFDSTLVVLSLMALLELKNYLASFSFLLTFLLSASLKFNHVFKENTYSYAALPLLFILMFVIVKRRDIKC